MKTRLIIDEDSVYEIDEECDKKREEREKEKRNKGKAKNKRKPS